MPRFKSPLDNVHVAAPCSANWDEMNGDEQVRHCSSCQLNVYNLSEMSRRQAEKLLIEREGRLCIRFYRRLDGTIITQNCPKGIAAIRRRLSRAATAIFSAIFTFLSGIGIFSAVSLAQREQVTQGTIAIPVNQTKPQVNNQNNNTVISQPYYETTGVMANFQTELPKTIKKIKKLHSIKSVKRTNNINLSDSRAGG